MRAIPKVKVTEMAQLFDNVFEASAFISLSPDQKWYVQKGGYYYYVWRKCGIKLRLTPTAFNKLFEIEEAKND